MIVSYVRYLDNSSFIILFSTFPRPHVYIYTSVDVCVYTTERMVERRLRAASSSDNTAANQSGHPTSTLSSTGSAASTTAAGMDGSRAVHPAIHVDLSRPRHNQSIYWGRARHFWETVYPLNIFISSSKLEEAARVVQMYK